MRRCFPIILLFVVIVFACFGARNINDVLAQCDIVPISSSNDNSILTFSSDKLDEVIDCLKVEIHSKKVIADRLIIEGYSHLISDYIVIGELKTNIQISVTDDEMIVGSPLIYGSF